MVIKKFRGMGAKQLKKAHGGFERSRIIQMNFIRKWSAWKGKWCKVLFCNEKNFYERER